MSLPGLVELYGLTEMAQQSFNLGSRVASR